MKPIIRKILQLAPCILAGFLLPTAPVQADVTILMKPPPVTKFVVTCEYIAGSISPLQMHVAGQGIGWGNVAWVVEFKNMQTGLSHTQTPSRWKALPRDDIGIYPFPGLQPGIYDVTVSWIGVNNLPNTSEPMLVFKGLKIPNITLTGGRGTGCQI